MTLGKGHLSDAFFQDLSELPVLLNLSICDSALGGGINEATIQHDRLRNLHIVKCRSHRIAVRLAFRFSCLLVLSVIEKKMVLWWDLVFGALVESVMLDRIVLLELNGWISKW